MLSTALLTHTKILQICHGVQALHTCNPPLAHRDIKPHNVLLQQHQQHESQAAVAVGSHSNPSDDLEAQPLRAEAGGGKYHAVVMDFGSCQEAHVQVNNRAEALAVQEDAEVRTALMTHSTSIKAAGAVLHKTP